VLLGRAQDGIARCWLANVHGVVRADLCFEHPNGATAQKWKAFCSRRCGRLSRQPFSPQTAPFSSGDREAVSPLFSAAIVQTYA
jgi:hypothetical protein